MVKHSSVDVLMAVDKQLSALLSLCGDSETSLQAGQNRIASYQEDSRIKEILIQIVLISNI